MSNQYRPQRFEILPVGVKNLLIINGLFFLATLTLDYRFDIWLARYLGLYNFQSPNFRLWQPLTHMFMHGDIGHIFSNMFMLWMFGSAIENYMGTRRFLIFYFITAFGAALCYMGVQSAELALDKWKIERFLNEPTLDYFNAIGINTARLSAMGTDAYFAAATQLGSGQIPDEGTMGMLRNMFYSLWEAKLNTPMVGASGAVFGVLFAFGFLFGESLIFIYFFPVKAKYAVGLFALLELYLGMQNNPSDNVAHFAHLGGMLFAWLLLRKTKRRPGNF